MIRLQVDQCPHWVRCDPPRMSLRRCRWRCRTHQSGLGLDRGGSVCGRGDVKIDRPNAVAVSSETGSGLECIAIRVRNNHRHFFKNGQKQSQESG